MSNSSLPERHRRQRWLVAAVGALLPLALFFVFADGDQSPTGAGSDLVREVPTTLSTTAPPSGGEPQVDAALPPAAPVTAPVGASQGNEARAAAPSGPRSPRVGHPVSPSDPVRIVIPAIAVDTSLVPIGLNPDQSMETPDFGVAGWYTEGPRPGEQGPAVIAAHVDSYQGPDVFFRLRELSPGQEVHVYRHDGSVTRFVVEGSEQTPKEDLPADRIWKDTDEAVLSLVTCGGTFDRSSRSYRDNVIVYAKAAT